MFFLGTTEKKNLDDVAVPLLHDMNTDINYIIVYIDKIYPREFQEMNGNESK